MKYILLIASLTLWGCISRGDRECAEIHQVKLKFEYENSTDDLRSDNISMVDVFIFDNKDGMFVCSKKVDREALNQFQGVNLDLPQGDYRIVCWANAARYTQFCSINNQSKIDNPDQTFVIDSKLDDPSCDHLFYAPKEESHAFVIKVPAPTQSDYTIGFRAAHVHIDFYITGLDELLGRKAHLTHTIELTNIPPRYDFQLHTYGDPIYFTQTTQDVVIQDVETEVASFNIPLLDPQNNIVVNLRTQPDNKIVASIKLRDFLATHYPNFDPDSVEPQILKIHFDFDDGQVQISIPEWGEETINPEI